MKNRESGTNALHQEDLLTIPQAARRLPTRDHGRHVHPSTVWRWTKRGIRGVRLEIVKIGGSTYTSQEALQRFSDRLSRADSNQASNSTSAEPEIERQLRDAGIIADQTWEGQHG